MKMKSLWLSRQTNGLYMLTYLKPELHRIKGTESMDFYIVPGEPIGVRHLCTAGVKSIFGVDIEIGNQIEVEVTAQIKDFEK